MDPETVSIWLSNVQPEDNPPPPSKRRKLSGSESYNPTKALRTVTPSQSPDQVLVKEPAFPEEEAELGDMNDNRQMPPPPSPSETGSRRDCRSQSNTSLGRSNSARTPAEKVDSSDYRRRVLAPNKVRFKRYSDKLPEDVAQVCTKILGQEAEGIQAAVPSELEELLDALDGFEREDPSEGKFCEIMTDHGLLPILEAHRGMSLRKKIAFNKSGLPRSSSSAIAPISGPAPDLSYGYKGDTFDFDWWTICQQPTCEPIKNLHFPFLVIEAKSQPMGSNVWQAQNQCAGGGTACVSAVANLQDRAYNIGLPPEAPDGMLFAFSLAIDSFTAWLHVHWRDTDAETYFLKPVQDYQMYRAGDLEKLRMHLNAIIEWGLGSRLETIRKTLESLTAAGTNVRKRAYDDE